MKTPWLKTRPAAWHDQHPTPGTFAITPASIISIQAIGQHQYLLRGIGSDWGSGVGGLAIATAKIPAVTQLLGMEISEANVDTTLANARLNKVEGKSYTREFVSVLYK